MKVLIAEDELVTRTVIARAVAHAGHEVATAPDGREMLRVFSEFHPDVLLVDWQMPILNGVDAIRELRKKPGGVDAFVILVTGINGDAETAEAMEAGIDDYVLKPISAPRLRVVLKLTQARLGSRKRGMPRGTLQRVGPSPDELLSCFGPLVALDGSGRVTFTSASVDDASNYVGEPVERLFGGPGQDAFASASLDAATSHEMRTFEASMAGRASTLWAVQPLFRNDNLVGFVIAEPERLGGLPEPVLDQVANA